MSDEFVTTLHIRHQAGSQEGANFQRDEWVAAIEDRGGDVRYAATEPGSAAARGLQDIMRDEDA